MTRSPSATGQATPLHENPKPLKKRETEPLKRPISLFSVDDEVRSAEPGAAAATTTATTHFLYCQQHDCSYAFSYPKPQNGCVITTLIPDHHYASNMLALANGAAHDNVSPSYPPTLQPIFSNTAQQAVNVGPVEDDTKKRMTSTGASRPAAN